VTLVEAQVTVTAEAGAVAHPVNDAPPACTLSVQFCLLSWPLRMLQVTVLVELPATLPRSGSVAEKLMVAGVAVIGLSVAA